MFRFGRMVGVGISLCVLMVGTLSLAAPQDTPVSPASPSPEEREMLRLLQESRQFVAKKEYAAAEQPLRQGLEKARQAQNRVWEGRFLNTLGTVYGQQERMQLAIETFRRALDVREKLSDKKEQAETLNNLGRACEQMGLFPEAVDHLKRALALKEMLNDARSLYTTLNNLGIAYSRYGQYEEAMHYYERAQSLDIIKADSQQQAVLSMNMGNVRLQQGQFDTALALFSRALARYEQEGNKRRIGDGLNNLGNVYYHLGQFEKARDYYRQALTIRETLPNSRDIATSSQNVGDANSALGQYAPAMEYHERALTLRRQLGDIQEIAKSLNSLGILHERTGRKQQALDLYNEALTLKERIGDERSLAITLQNLGSVYASLGQLDKALEVLERARGIAEKVGNHQDLSLIYSDLGSVHYLKKRPDRAERAYAQAVTHLEALNEQIGDPTQIGALHTWLARLYARYAGLLLDQKRPGEALVMLERGRGQGLARQAAQNQVNLAALFSREDATQWNAANRNRLAAGRLLSAAEERERQAIPAEKEVAQTHRVAAQKRLDAAERQMSLLQTALYRRYPDFRRLRGAEPPTFARLKALADRNVDTLFLEWTVVNEKTTLLFALAKQAKLQVFRLPVAEKTLSRLVSQWRTDLTALADPRSDKAAAVASEEKTARTLYRLLLDPLAKTGLLAPGRSRRLVVVSDGPLLDIPFAALLDSKGKRLIETHALSVSVSLDMLTWPANRRKPAAGLLCFADPAGEGSEIVRSATRGSFGALPAARRESEALIRSFPDAEGRFGKAAQEKEFKRLAESFALLHFATHGSYDGRDGRRSFLVLAAGGEEDGFLEAQEILGLKLAAQMATLSACETAQGQKSGGEGILGLAWAFRAAGCPSVVASQWKVDDAATGGLMTKFYEGLKQGKRKDDALRTAMLAVRNQPFRSPAYYWAAFQVIGDAAPVSTSSRH